MRLVMAYYEGETLKEKIAQGLHLVRSLHTDRPFSVPRWPQPVA